MQSNYSSIALHSWHRYCEAILMSCMFHAFTQLLNLNQSIGLHSTGKILFSPRAVDSGSGEGIGT